MKILTEIMMDLSLKLKTKTVFRILNKFFKKYELIRNGNRTHNINI